MRTIRVYRPGRNWNSFGVVADGIAGAAAELEMLAGVYEYAMPDEDNHAGEGCPVGIVCGDPGALGVCSFFGHKERILVLAANSSSIPQTVVRAIKQFGCTRVWTPSEWSAQQIFEATGSGGPQIQVVPHGISRAYKPVESMEALRKTPLYASLRRGGVSLLHLAESSPERKGTVELLKAFGPWVGSTDVNLTLVMAPLQASRMRELVDDWYGNPSNIHIMQHWNFAPAQMAWAYQCFDVVVQPSRAEGFGLVPLEALACGVPVVVTAATGHKQWLLSDSVVAEAFELADVGEPEPTDYDAGGLAPTIDQDALGGALELALTCTLDLQTAAQQAAQAVGAEWNWSAVLAPHLSGLERIPFE